MLEKGEKSLRKSTPKVVKPLALPFLSASDSLLLNLLEKRLNICMPLDYITITSHYGYRQDPFTKCQRFHDGIDLRCGNGLVYSMLPGRVAAVHHGDTGYGNYVIIYHGKMSDGNQYSTLYGHMRSVATSAGKYVQQGEIIGYVGSTGNSTGNHLHLEVWRGGSKANAVNPRGYIPMR